MQHRRQGAPLDEPATLLASSLVVLLTNAGNYTVVVTNAFGSVSSRIAALMFTTVH